MRVAWLACLAGPFAIGGAVGLPAQVLARPGWAGSGVAPVSWWRNAVFYRIDPTHFQATNGGGTGDLAGIVERLDYLGSLGVDALVLDTRNMPQANGTGGTDSLDDLIREASRHHLRLLLTVTPAMQQVPAQDVLRTVHGWLSAGAAGVFVPKLDSPGGSVSAGYPALVAGLNAMLRSFPGDRVVLTDPAAGEATASTVPRPPQRGRGGTSLPRGTGQLTTLALLPVEPPSAAALRGSLAAIAEGSGSATPGLLRFAEDPRTGSADAAGAAAVLLASRGTAMFDFGDELGLRAFPPASAPQCEASPVMQWTPRNRAEAAPAPVERAAPGTAPGENTGQTAFGAYHPYVHPPPGALVGGAPAAPRATVDGNLPAVLPDPDALPGFTTGELPNAPVDGETVNVVTEDRDPNSLLNAYRQLIALHHGNATLRDGAQIVLNRDAADRDADDRNGADRNAQNAVVWLRRAPAGARTSANVLAAVNLSGEPLTLSLDRELSGVGVHGGALRPLFTWSRQPLTGETTAALRLPPHAVFLGEVSHGGMSRAAPRAPRSRRRRR